LRPRLVFFLSPSALRLMARQRQPKRVSSNRLEIGTSRRHRHFRIVPVAPPVLLPRTASVPPPTKAVFFYSRVLQPGLHGPRAGMDVATAIGSKARYPGFVEPALATSVDKVPSARAGFMRSSSMATGFRCISPTAQSQSSDAGATIGQSASERSRPMPSRSTPIGDHRW